MYKGFVKLLSLCLVGILVTVSVPPQAVARVIGTEEAAHAPGGAAQPGANIHVPDRTELLAMLDRDDVRRQLESLGVNPLDARARVESLTDAEAHQLAERIGELPAGADTSILGILFAVFVILLITDILGLTKIFPFTRSIR